LTQADELEHGEIYIVIEKWRQSIRWAEAEVALTEMMVTIIKAEVMILVFIIIYIYIYQCIAKTIPPIKIV